ncbi:MAG TPA: ATP-binding cassette domain-containing protein [Stellaceae bacterium]|nr:ATP-binding cassette domain-containing protein [Stellaceae bacterium]
MAGDSIAISVEGLTIAFDGYVVQGDVHFTVRRGEVFVVMGGSGCGKSSLLRAMIGLVRPAAGDVFYDGRPFWGADDDERVRIQRRLGILFQSGALWSSLTLGENVGLPLSQYTALAPDDLAAVVELKLSLVGLRGFEGFYPSEISGGMKKRAGLARAMALDPDILFFDEPSAGLDPISSKRLDDLILHLRDALGATVVMVTHELPSIFAIADNAVFLDAETHTAIAHGNPRELLHSSENPKVRDFLRRGVQA